MANVTKITASDGVTYDIKDNISGYTTNSGTVTNVAAGAGLAYVDVEGTNIIREFHCNMKSGLNTSSLTAASKGSTSSREYPVGLDKSGYLSVNVPWEDDTYTATGMLSISSNTLNVVTASSSRIYASTTAAATTVAHNTNTDICTLSGLPVGSYILIGTVTWNGNRNGYRKLLFSSSAAGSNLSRYCNSQMPAYNTNTSDKMAQQLIYVLEKTSASSVIHLVAYQNSSASLGVSAPGIKAVRIS